MSTSLLLSARLFDNHETRDAKALCVITPASIGPQYYRESAVINVVRRTE